MKRYRVFWRTFGSNSQIAMSQGHTTDTAMRHYLNLGFTELDKGEMKDFVEGWI